MKIEYRLLLIAFRNLALLCLVLGLLVLALGGG